MTDLPKAQENQTAIELTRQLGPDLISTNRAIARRAPSSLVRANVARENLHNTFENPITMRTRPIYDVRAEFMHESPFNESSLHDHHAPRVQQEQPLPLDRLDVELGPLTARSRDVAPTEVGNKIQEIVLVAICSSGQLLFSLLQGGVSVNQQTFRVALGLQSTQLPWLNGSFLIALGLSVVIAGPLTDFAPPRPVIVGALTWLSLWSLICCFSLTPSRANLYFLARAFQGLAVGVLTSGSMGILGRLYKPGLRKTRVFSAMAAMAPLGFWVGALQGGAFSAHLVWIFGTDAILSALFCVAATLAIPPLGSLGDDTGSAAPSLRNFDYQGAICIGTAFVCILFGLTQGPIANWAPYTYALVIAGAVALSLFFKIESRAERPLIPNKLWRTQGFAPLMVAYFLGFGSFVGAWQFYAWQFFLRIQNKSSITVALYLLPNAIMGILATFIVSRLLHILPGHYIYVASMIFMAIGPACFLPQTANTTYWALSMPGIAVATFGPDLSFAAASIFITSSVSRNYQGSAGSLLLTVQNLSTAIMTAIADAIGSNVDLQADGDIGLRGLRAIWWFALGTSLLGAIIIALTVRIPKAEEKDYET